MNDIHSQKIIDFTTLSAKYCLELEQVAQNENPKEFIKKLLLLLPLLYTKATQLVDDIEDNGEYTENQVTEDDYNYIRNNIYSLIAQYDEYLDVFVEDMKYSDKPILKSISEDLADIYQDLRNFLAIYELGIEAQSSVALYEVIQQFTTYWGQRVVNVTRALHEIIYNEILEDC